MAKQTQELSLFEKLSKIQFEFKANKSKWNSFGKYNFRSAEDILEALKPFNEKYGVYFTIAEEVVFNGDMPVMISKAAIHDVNGLNEVVATAIVGVDLQQKGMQTPQAFGSASSYGKKYALGNLLLIDDTQDSDATNNHGQTTSVPKPEVKKTKLDVKDEAFTKALEFIEKGGSLDSIKNKYELTPEALKQLTK